MLRQVDRSKDTLWFASEQSLSYLDGTLPADYGFGRVPKTAKSRLLSQEIQRLPLTLSCLLQIHWAFQTLRAREAS